MATKQKKPTKKAASQKVAYDRRGEDLKRERHISRELSRRVSELEAEQRAASRISRSNRNFTIRATQGKESEATAVLVASDWHIEEVVTAEQVNGLNEFDKKICEERVRRFFRHGLKLVQKEQHAAKIDTLILALLGDFISGSIHEELLEGNRLRPINAVLEAQGYLVAGIQYILDNSNLKLVIPCHSGNHGRMTQKLRVSTEAGNSLERLMYSSLADRFADNKRITFIVSEGYHSYMDVYGYVLRFHHGHATRFQGGIGGLTIPFNKAIAQWNKGHRAHLDVSGHYHTFFDGGNFIVNGSLVGYNAFALSIKASPEQPVQAFFLIDSKFGKTVVVPVILSHDR